MDRVAYACAIIDKSLVRLISTNIIKYGSRGVEDPERCGYFKLLAETRVKLTSHPPSDMLFFEILLL
jgi:hypothetical protein